MNKVKWFCALKSWLAPGIEEVKNNQLKCAVNMKAGRLELDMNSLRESKEVQRQLEAVRKMFKEKRHE